VHDLIKQAQNIINKKERLTVPSQQKVKGVETVFIVENDSNEFAEISVALLKAGYKVDSAESGAKAIEKMMLSQPDVALIKLGLTDLSGDLVTLRLNRMAQTSFIKCILYVHRNYEHKQAVIDNLKKKTGVFSFVEYQSANELLGAIDQVIKEEK
ncbi:MAG: response regulator transcription factor, partial [Alphaproteobacteria bacterium]|nr:response regulator transcription factor [Alphaproteobacteria bacterium]